MNTLSIVISIPINLIGTMFIVHMMNKKYRKNIGEGSLHISMISMLLGFSGVSTIVWLFGISKESIIYQLSLLILVTLCICILLSLHWIMKGKPILGPGEKWR